MTKQIVVAVAGNPNTGKTTFVNALAGTRLRVGNWPGVTVEKKEALLRLNGKEIFLVDLPGTYSLSPYSEEEIIARDFLVKERPDVVLNVVDATHLERNLYLTLQILETGCPVVLVLNMYDEARRRGLEINLARLSALLGIPVVPTVAVKGEGLQEALQQALELAASPNPRKKVHYGEEIEGAIKEIEDWLGKNVPQIAVKYPLRWLALKLLEGDPRVLQETGLKIPEDLPLIRHLQKVHGDLSDLLIEARYGLAAGLVRQCIKEHRVEPPLSEKLDRLLLNRYLGPPLFALAMWLVFKVAFDFSAPFVDWFDGLIGATGGTLSYLLKHLSVPDWLYSLIIDGLVSGVGAVAVFLPLIFILMLVLTFLEGSGYLARVAFLVDRLFSFVGLHGKCALPLLLGFGCNVPCVYATRVLESRRDRILTVALAPFMSCGARLPVYVLFAAAFFGPRAGTVIWSLYLLGVVVALVLALVLQRTLLREEPGLFVMELPPYRMPGWRYLLVHAWEKTRHFAVKAGTYIVVISMLVWALLHLPPGQDLRHSYLGRLGAFIAPVFRPLGFAHWEAGAALVTGVLAKEMVVSTLGQIYGTEKREPSAEISFPWESWKEVIKGLPLAFVEAGKNLWASFSPVSLEAESPAPKLLEKIRQKFDPFSAYAFMVFTLLYAPCMVVLASAYAEFRSLKLLAIMVGAGLFSAYLLGILIYQIGHLF